MMGDEGAEQQYSWDRFFGEINTRMRDLEEKQRLLKERVLLVSRDFMKEREKNVSEIQEMKKSILRLQEENRRLKEMVMMISERVDQLARKEDVFILQRQFDLFRER